MFSTPHPMMLIKYFYLSLKEVLIFYWLRTHDQRFQRSLLYQLSHCHYPLSSNDNFFLDLSPQTLRSQRLHGEQLPEDWRPRHRRLQQAGPRGRLHPLDSPGDLPEPKLRGQVRRLVIWNPHVGGFDLR